MKKTVLLYKIIPEDLKQRLEAHFNVISVKGITPQNLNEVSAALSHAEGLIGSSVQIDASLLDKAPKLKAISTISVGFDNFNVEDLTHKGIRLMHTPGVLTDTTADTMFMLILATARRAVELSMMIRRGEWHGSIGENLYGTDVHHKTIGILGMGRIGSALAKRAHCGFDMKVLYTSRHANPEAEQRYQATRCKLDELLAQSDFVCITLPLSSETEGLIDEHKLALMKPSAILINAARGKIVNQAALFRALQQKTLRAAGLDVFETEPLPLDSPLLTLQNVVLLPHIGSATTETRHAMVNCAIDNLIVALSPEPPEKNWVNPQVG